MGLVPVGKDDTASRPRRCGPDPGDTAAYPRKCAFPRYSPVSESVDVGGGTHSGRGERPASRARHWHRSVRQKPGLRAQRRFHRARPRRRGPQEAGPVLSVERRQRTCQNRDSAGFLQGGLPMEGRPAHHAGIARTRWVEVPMVVGACRGPGDCRDCRERHGGTRSPLRSLPGAFRDGPVLGAGIDQPEADPCLQRHDADFSVSRLYQFRAQPRTRSQPVHDYRRRIRQRRAHFAVRAKGKALPDALWRRSHVSAT